jgi:hypothetical protein
MRVSEITQRLLDQSKEGPRFHDLLRIYQIQNMALAEKPRTSNYVGACASLPFNVTSTPSQQSRPPLEISDFRNFEKMDQSRKTNIDSDGTSTFDVPTFNTKDDTILLRRSPIELVLPPIISSGEIQSMNLPKFQAMLSCSKKGLIHTASTRKHTTELSSFRVRRSYSKSGKRLRSTWNSASELAASFLLTTTDVEYDYRQTEAGGQEYTRSLGQVWNIRPAL